MSNKLFARTLSIAMSKDSVRERCKATFAMLDVNNDGHITIEDYELLVKRFKEEDNWSDQAADAFKNKLLVSVAKFGFKQDTSWNLEQYKDIVVSMADKPEVQEAFKEMLKTYFDAFDSDKNGYLSPDEWLRMMKLLRYPDPEKHAKESFDLVDINKDGQISLEEYLAINMEYWLTGENQYGTKDMLDMSKY